MLPAGPRNSVVSTARTAQAAELVPPNNSINVTRDVPSHFVPLPSLFIQRGNLLTPKCIQRSLRCLIVYPSTTARGRPLFYCIRPSRHSSNRIGDKHTGACAFSLRPRPLVLGHGRPISVHPRLWGGAAQVAVSPRPDAPASCAAIVQLDFGAA